MGIASECLGLTRADYLEEIARNNFLPCHTWEESSNTPCNTRSQPQLNPSITRYEEEIKNLKIQVLNLQKQNSQLSERSAITFVYDVMDFESITKRILFELKMGRQASGYKAAKKALNRFIQEIKHRVDSF